jgi:hypothetical protein
MAPERSFDLRVGEGVTLEPADPPVSDDQAGGGPALRLPAEALIRLVYGRLDPAHTPPVEATEVDLDDLRQVFPGF